MPSLSCPGCGTGLTVPDEFAGKRVKCRQCGAPFQIPGGSPTGVQTQQPVPAGARGQSGPPVKQRPPQQRRPQRPEYEDEDDDYDDEEDDRPKRKKRSKSKAKGKGRKSKKKGKKSDPRMMIVFGVIGAGVLAIAVMIGIYAATNQGGDTKVANKGDDNKTNNNSPDPAADGNESGNPSGSGGAGAPDAVPPAQRLEYIPDNTAMVVFANLGQIVKSQTIQQLSKSKEDIKSFLESEFAPDTPIVPTDFTSVLFAAPPSQFTNMNANDWMLVLHHGKDDLMKLTLDTAKKKPIPRKVNNFTTYSDPKSSITACQPTNGVMLISNSGKTMEKILKRGSANSKLSEMLKKGLEEVSQTSSFFVVVDGTKVPTNKFDELRKQMKLSGPPPEFDLLTMEGTITGEVDLKTVFHFKRKQSAYEIKNRLEEGMAALKDKQTVNLIKQASKGIDPTHFADGIQFRIEESKLIITARFSSSTLLGQQPGSGTGDPGTGDPGIGDPGDPGSSIDP